MKWIDWVWRPRSRSLLGVMVLVVFPQPSVAPAQTWETAQNQSCGPACADQYFLPPYPVIFVAAEIYEVPSGSGVKGKFHIGTDVLSANNPDRGHQLWILLPDGQAKKLFPLDVHEQLGLIASPPGEMDKGAVVEPNVSEDGAKVYFAFFHDTTFAPASGSEFDRISYKGADLYSIDLSPLLANYGADPSTLAATRLTTHVYGGNGQQTDADKFKSALNPTLVTSGTNNWGTVFMHATEMRTRAGLKLVFVSDERRVQNSNASMAKANHNFNLHIADLAANGTLANTRQLQYYTTTSVLSPTAMRDGLAISYQSSTTAARMWHAQRLDSEGRWYPLLGYGIHPELIHLGAFCIDTKSSDPGDYYVATRYYNANNEGFGALWAQDLAASGQNTYDLQTQWVVMPRQVGAYKLSQGANSNDYPSAKIGGQYVGKFTTPRCARPDELLMAYSPTSANGRLNDEEGNKSIYRSWIGYRPNLAPFHPFDPVNLAQETGLRIVIRDLAELYTLVWPVPVLSWQQRTGDSVQRVAAPIADPATTILAGLPHAQVGTSAIYNTDRKPFDCWLGPSFNPMRPYSPNKAHSNVNQENDQLINNQDGLTYIQNQNNFCQPLDSSSVLGIALSVTSNKANMAFNFGYETDGNGKKEMAKLLGVYDIRQQADDSFQAVIPSNVPFEFHLLDRQYGMKLVDVRSWHSLKARETRTDCGGCHQHEPGQAIAFEGKVASQQAPLDLATLTPWLSYDVNCDPLLQTSTAAALDVPEWKEDIWPSFQTHCDSCHRVGVSSDPTALAALGYNGESDAYNQLENRNWANTKVGALGSPAFWAARGQRTDGRDNTLTKYQPDYSQGEWGYRFSGVHTNQPGLCNGAGLGAAQWVASLGRWIDNHMPRDTGYPRGAKFDWYHPTVDAALSAADCSPAQLRVGYWDDTGLIKRLEVSAAGALVQGLDDLANGYIDLTLPALVSGDTVKVVAYDAADNRQTYERPIEDLMFACSDSDLIFADGFENGLTPWS